MNWCDYTVIAIIAIFAVVGLIRGFVFSVFKIASFFAAIFLSIKLYPRASEFLAGTTIAGNIKGTILENLQKRYEAVITAGIQAGGSTADSVMGELHIPAFLKQSIADRLPRPEDYIDIKGILNSISDQLTCVIINVMSILLIFILIRLGIFFIGIVLKGLVKLPVLRQFDRLGGFAFGIVEGLIAVYVLFTLLFLFNSSHQFQDIFSDLDASLLAKGFYQNNILIGWMFPKPY